MSSLKRDDELQSDSSDLARMTITAQQQPTAVDVFAPWADDEERAIRLRMHKALTIALAHAAREPNGSARDIYYVAADVAHRWVFTRATKDDLTRILWALNQLFKAASHIVVVEGGNGD